MTLFQAILLGVVQGLTEYIPVSSTAHLLLVPWLLGWQYDPASTFVFTVLVQWGTLLGVLVYFRSDIAAIARSMASSARRRQPLAEPEARLGWFVLAATVPAAVFGLLLESFFESVFGATPVTIVLLIVTAGLLLAAERWGGQQRTLETMRPADAIAIGLWQVLSLVPGVSRSGATVSGGMLRGFVRPDAARFSFLMSIPALLGAGVVALKDLLSTPGLLPSLFGPLAAGFIASTLSGYLCVHWLLGYLRRGSLGAFALYRVVFGGLCLIVLLARGG